MQGDTVTESGPALADAILLPLSSPTASGAAAATAQGSHASPLTRMGVGRARRQRQTTAAWACECASTVALRLPIQFRYTEEQGRMALARGYCAWRSLAGAVAARRAPLALAVHSSPWDAHDHPCGHVYRYRNTRNNKARLARKVHIDTSKPARYRTAAPSVVDGAPRQRESGAASPATPRGAVGPRLSGASRMSSSPTGGAPAPDDLYKDQNDTWVDRAVPEWLRPYAKLTRIDRPIGTWLLLWPGCWSIALAAPAGSFPDLKLLATFGGCCAAPRGASAALTRLRRRDAHRSQGLAP